MYVPFKGLVSLFKRLLFRPVVEKYTKQKPPLLTVHCRPQTVKDR